MNQLTTEEQIIKLFKTLLKDDQLLILDMLKDLVDDDEEIEVETTIDDDDFYSHRHDRD